jgi:uncharacterized FlgJ-related protein
MPERSYRAYRDADNALREVGAAINAAIVHEAGIYSARQSFYSKALINPKHTINFWVIMADEHEQFEEPQPYDAAA